MDIERFMAIDPLALILRPDIYVRLHLPDPLPMDAVREQVQGAVRGLNANERKTALLRVRVLTAFAHALERELAHCAGETAS